MGKWKKGMMIIASMKYFLGSLSTLILATLLGFSGVYWFFQWQDEGRRLEPMPPGTQVAFYQPPSVMDQSAMAHFLGGFVPVVVAPPVVDELPKDIALWGIAFSQGRPSVAVISVGTQPAQPVTVGQRIASEAYVLTGIERQQVNLAKVHGSGVLKALPPLVLSSLSSGSGTPGK
jgi:hypothetical protein